MNKQENWVKFFINSAGAILLASGLERFLVATGHAPVLSLPDPLLGIPLRYAVAIVGAAELLVAFICLFGKQRHLQVGWLVWLSTVFVIYRLGALYDHAHPQGSCIGSLTDPLHISRGYTGVIARAFPFYLVLGSYAIATWAWLGSKIKLFGAKATESARMSCPSCGNHIRFALQDAGRQIPCPRCQAAITLRKPEDNFKMSCHFCKEHIEFPPHATGEKIKCPHCKMDITLKALA